MAKLKQKRTFDGIDEERFEGIFLPLERHLNRYRDREKDLKGVLLENIETILNEIIEDLSDKGKN